VRTSTAVPKAPIVFSFFFEVVIVYPEDSIVGRNATTMMKSILLVFLLVVSLSATAGFVQPHHAALSQKTELFTKKNPQGLPITVQEDEDAAMWIEDDKTGKRKAAIKGPIGGRPINKVTKDMLQGKQGAKKANKPWWKK
jgi:hypothetical protein